ncbi:MAG: hypothetical protein ABJN40_06350 [Sneathiella sp.]
MSKETKTVLAGNDAVDLWLQGKDAWNKWVEENPKAFVDFSGVNFGDIGTINNLASISFKHFCFPDGPVFFKRAYFGQGTISFEFSNFGDGLVSFQDATFNKSNVLFNNASYGDGGVSFKNVMFGESSVDFGNVSFGTGDLLFTEVTFRGRAEQPIMFEGMSFGKGTIYFDNTNFENVDVAFSDSNFESRNISFKNVMFIGGSVHFSQILLGSGFLSFENASFEKCEFAIVHSNLGNSSISWNDARFLSGQFIFRHTIGNKGQFSMERVMSNIAIHLEGIQSVENLTKLSFHHTSFENSLILPPGCYNCVPDLRNTKITKAITFHDIITTLKRTKKKWWEFWKVRKALDLEDASRFRRLKELAEINRDHQAALTYHANELRALRWVKSSIPASILDATFSWASDYGQSVWRPIRAFLLMDLFFFGFYISSSSGNWIEAAKIVAANSLPFLTYSRAVQMESIQAMYGDQIPNFVTTLTFVQGIGSVVFLFLLGLGLRNRFRI